MSESRVRILFLCTGNSARSILAEAIANQVYGERLWAVSAGSRPRGEPQPLALETLRAKGLRAEGYRSESWDLYRDEEFDLVVTLCDSAAAETCPVFPGHPVQVHWGLPDPPEADDPAGMFVMVFEMLHAGLGAFVETAGAIDERAARVAGMIAAARETDRV